MTTSRPPCHEAAADDGASATSGGGERQAAAPRYVGAGGDLADEQFDDGALLARREADHKAIDDVLASRVAAEDDELARISGPPPLLDRLLKPLNRLGTQRSCTRRGPRCGPTRSRCTAPAGKVPTPTPHCWLSSRN